VRDLRLEDGAESTLDVCDDAGTWTHPERGECIIDGKLWIGGVNNPANECESCDPTVCFDSWTPHSTGFACASDGFSCTADVCDGAGTCTHDVSVFGSCTIDGQCLTAGAQSDADPCLICDPTQSTTEFVISEACLAECQTNDGCDDGEACVEGTCQPTTECDENRPCAEGICVDGQCVPVMIAAGSFFGCSATAAGGGAMLLPLLGMGWALRRRQR
jgi:uncharacterized protein (TIGR03382 family)